MSLKKRSVHDLSNYSWTSLRAGELTPIKCVEVIPNDTVKIRSEAVIRLDALNTPVMHPLKVKIFHFFSANRQVWENWNDFITQGADGADSSVHPYITLTDTTGGVSDLPERLGFPLIQTGATENVSALPFAHYWNIVLNYFTDDQLDAAYKGFEGNVLTDGDNSAKFNANSLLRPFPVSWKKDYFTTARPQAELGGAVPIPQSGIVRKNNAPGSIAYVAGSNTLAGANLDIQTDGAGGDIYGVGTGNPYLNIDNSNGLEMDETAVMRDLTVAGALQLFRENRQEVGTRIINYLRGIFGSQVSSYELQEPVLINYAEKTIRFSEVLQTAEGSDPVGTLRGHGIGGMGSNETKFTVPEHGFIITMMYIMPEPAYLSSAERFWFKTTFTDYFQPEFEAIGQQAILRKEIAAGYTSNTGVFGYTDPYDEYRRCLNTVSGTFATTDKEWHMARDFGGVIPMLNTSFIHGEPTQRIFADTTGEVYKVFAFNEMVARRIVKRVVRKKIL